MAIIVDEEKRLRELRERNTHVVLLDYLKKAGQQTYPMDFPYVANEPDFSGIENPILSYAPQVAGRKQPICDYEMSKANRQRIAEGYALRYWREQEALAEGWYDQMLEVGHYLPRPVELEVNAPKSMLQRTKPRWGYEGAKFQVKVPSLAEKNKALRDKAVKENKRILAKKRKDDPNGLWS